MALTAIQIRSSTILAISTVALIAGILLAARSWTTISKANLVPVLGKPFAHRAPVYNAEGNPVRLADKLVPGRWAYIIEGPSAGLRPNLSQLTYAQVLVAKYPTQLRFVYIQNSDRPSSPVAEGWASSAPDVAVLRSQVEALPGPTRVTLVDPKGIVRFSAPYLIPNETFRELTERYLVGGINYRAPALTAAKVGAQLPHLAIIGVADARQTNLATVVSATAKVNRGSATIIFLQARCSSCSVGNFIRRLQTIESKLGSLTKAGIYPVFSRAFDFGGFEYLKNTQLGAELFVAAGPCPEWEDEYYVGPDSSKDAFVVSTDSRGSIAKIESWNDWAGRLLDADVKCKGCGA